MELSKLRERQIRRKGALASNRAPWEPIWRDTANLVSPIKSRFLFSRSTNGRKQSLGNSTLLDPYGTWAMRVLQAGMTSGLTSASRPWFKLETEDPDLMESQAVKVWLADTQQKLYSGFAKSNFYAASKAGYGEMGTFGQEACLMAEDYEKGIVCYPMQTGEYYIGLNYRLEPDTLFRRCDMTVKQLFDRFVGTRYGDRSMLPKNVLEAYDKGDYGVDHETWHGIEPNHEAEPTKVDKRNMPWRSTYWLGNCDEKGKEFLEVSGYPEQPFWAPRWEPQGSETYSTCPGMDILGDLREMQMTKLRKGQARDFIVRPALKAPYSMQNSQKALLPAGVSYMAGVDNDSFKPLWEVKPEVIGLLTAEQQELHASIDRGSYADLFMAITQMDGGNYKNLEEILARQDEKMTQLGPVVERALTEKLKVAIDRAYAIMNRRGEFMEPPEEMLGKPIKIVFVSILAQLQRVQEIRQIERLAGFVGNLSGVYQEVVDKFDADQAVDKYANALGTDPSLVVADEIVAERRKARAQQQAAAAAAETAAVTAPAANQAAQAAKVLSETRINPQGETALARMFG